MIINGNQVVQVHFQKGHLIRNNVIWMKLNEQDALIGRMSYENDHVLKNVKAFKVSEVGKYKGIYLVKNPQQFEEAEHLKKILPIEIMGIPAEQRIKIKPSKTVYFSRYKMKISVSRFEMFES